MEVREIRVKSVLNRSGEDYTVNPYVGCSHACVYCYARYYTKKFKGFDGWGSVVEVKVNAAEVLERELTRKYPRKVFMSTICDPYQPIEAEYRITRKILEIFASHGGLLKTKVTIVTKSTMVLRDLDLLRELKAVVALSLTTDDEDVRRLFEPNASSVSERVETLKILKENGLKTCVFISPILPMNTQKLVSMIEGLVDCVFVDPVNYRWLVEDFYKKHGLSWALKDEYFEKVKREICSRLGKNLIL